MNQLRDISYIIQNYYNEAAVGTNHTDYLRFAVQHHFIPYTIQSMLQYAILCLYIDLKRYIWQVMFNKSNYDDLSEDERTILDNRCPLFTQVYAFHSQSSHVQDMLNYYSDLELTVFFENLHK